MFILDYDAQSKDKRNATVTCYDENDPPHGPLMTTFRTPTDNSLNTTLETSYSSVLATTDNILHTTSRTSRTSVSVAQVTSLNVSSTSTETTSGVSDRQTNDEDEKSNSTTGMYKYKSSCSSLLNCYFYEDINFGGL